MSGHETIRVLEVEVDSPFSGDCVKAETITEEGRGAILAQTKVSSQDSQSATTTGKKVIGPVGMSNTSTF